jgi:hypothetical protein
MVARRTAVWHPDTLTRTSSFTQPKRAMTHGFYPALHDALHYTGTCRLSTAHTHLDGHHVVGLAVPHIRGQFAPVLADKLLDLRLDLKLQAKGSLGGPDHRCRFLSTTVQASSLGFDNKRSRERRAAMTTRLNGRQTTARLQTRTIHNYVHSFLTLSSAGGYIRHR